MKKIHCVLMFALWAGTTTDASRGAEKVDFVKKIQPILENSCVRCHGPDKQKGELRLDGRAAALEGGVSENAIVPGKADESLLHKMIALPADDLDRMPARSDPLSQAETDLLRDWINQGAAWPDGVVLEAVKKPKPDGSGAAKLVTTAPAGVPTTEAEKQAVARLRKQGALVLRLARETHLLRVDFLGNAKKVDLSPLTNMPNLYELDLGGTAVDDAALAHVKTATHLTRLYLEKTKITDAGLAQLCGLGDLVYLNLYGTTIGDAGVEKLAGLENLRKIYLWQTTVTDEGAKRLAAALPRLEINRGWTPPVIKKPEPAQLAINDKCPITGSAVKAEFSFVYEGKRIGFCCGDCCAKFAKDPKKYIDKVKGF